MCDHQFFVVLSCLVIGDIASSSALPFNASPSFRLCLSAAVDLKRKKKNIAWRSLKYRYQGALCMFGWVIEQGAIQRDLVKSDAWLCRVTLHLSPHTTSLETERKLIKAHANGREWREVMRRHSARFMNSTHPRRKGNRSDTLTNALSRYPPTHGRDWTPHTAADHCRKVLNVGTRQSFKVVNNFKRRFRQERKKWGAVIKPLIRS